MLPIFRSHLHDNGVLIHRIVDRGNLAFAKRVVQSIIDSAWKQSEATHREAIHLEIGLHPILLLIRIQIRQFGTLSECFDEFWRPTKDLAGVIALQRELILRQALTPADVDILHRLKI